MNELGGEGLWLRLVIAALATWRVTHLLAREDGPFDAIVKFRAWLGNAGRVLDCFYCLSLWVAAPLALVVSTSLGVWCVVWLALSGAACLMNRITEPPVVMQPSQGEQDGMLWTEKGRDLANGSDVSGDELGSESGVPGRAASDERSPRT